MTNCMTRLAPSPTGTLHMGNARTFLVNWAMARQSGWRIIMRIEDLDAQRVREGAAERLLDTLAWLGIDFDDGPFYQSRDLEPYRAAMRTLTDSHRAYACGLTRKQIQQATSAPHIGDSEVRFEPNLRPKSLDSFRFLNELENYRFVVADQPIEVHDCFAGCRTFHPFNECGDFVIWTRLGAPAYQLAVVVDDARQGVTDVVRGDDLLPSAARQMLLYEALGLRAPRWWHLPLVLGPDGRRLAKRTGQTHLETFREAGVPARRVIGMLAKWCNLTCDRVEMTAQDFLRGFRLDTLSRESVTFGEEDHAWLLHGH
jgi:glutamyl-tRNA synthetase